MAERSWSDELERYYQMEEEESTTLKRFFEEQRDGLNDFTELALDSVSTVCSRADPRALHKQEGGNHYDLPIQPIEYIMKNELGFCEANVVKYVSRHKFKNGVSDLRKAIHYLELLIELEYGDE